MTNDIALGRLRLLLLEDSEADQYLVSSYLDYSKRDYTLTSVKYLSEALETLKGGGFDACLSDFRLPDGNGIDLLELARLHGLQIPIVVFTGHTETELGLRVTAAGAADFICKNDLDSATLWRVLEHVVLRHRGLQYLSAEDKAAPLLNVVGRRHFVNLAYKELLRGEERDFDTSLVFINLPDVAAESEAEIWRGLLNRVADMLKSFTRRSDIVAYLGEGNFCLLLEGANKARARSVMGEIKLSLPTLPLPSLPAGSKIERLAVQCGISTCRPGQSHSLSSMMEEAKSDLAPVSRKVV